ncbi:5-formyltetrahydrofolate cyclo-ligase [Sediminivirga luteola]|uniref:5-formyltetrahydrofolate cyclo-ligase n=1 Tax=Sediminivirga luteola TaxID=1774748 RepID=A0A8J2TVJ3_9MICO|nr:5-formyltetrahydrofolate cyclo-ligase [Sediminivirga luteola]MCI2265917.1 hypothetical protein [Sediminivirga luteola]GGA03824.1 hypothetical protein GCM10011333_03250 [Sediminivirga luteola]
MTSLDGKAALRSRIRADRRLLDVETRRERASRLAGVLASLLPCRGLAAYAPMPHEPDIVPLLQAAHRAGVPVWLPVARGRNALRWGRWDPDELDLLAPGTGSFGIAEPAEASLNSQDLLHTVDVILIPALALSSGGLRLGQGGGYYDRSFGPQGEAPAIPPAAAGAGGPGAAATDVTASARPAAEAADEATGIGGGPDQKATAPDRARWAHGGHPGRPLLAGVVYEEEVLPADSIPAAGHDLRVHAVATPAGLRCI